VNDKCGRSSTRCYHVLEVCTPQHIKVMFSWVPEAICNSSHPQPSVTLLRSGVYSLHT